MMRRWLLLVIVLGIIPSSVWGADTLTKAVKDFQALEGDSVRALRRDLWLALAERMVTLSTTAPTADDGVRALWYAARAWEEVARRSALPMDARRAAGAFARVPQKAPAHPLADDALLRQAQNLLRAGDPAAARQVLEQVLAKYPQGDMAPQARQELARIRSKPAPNASGAPPPPGASPPSAALPHKESLRSPSPSSSPKGAASPLRPPPQKKQEGNLVEQLGLSVRTVVLDAGHGGSDPGAMAFGLREKDINLRMVRMLAPLLEAQGFRVVQTRTKDQYLSLDERTRRANAAKGDLFLSIHCNAHYDAAIHGFELYFLDLATDKQAIRVAARENGVSESKISDMQMILSDLLLHAKIEESKTLARVVQREVMAGAGARFALRDHGARGAFFYVLTGVRMPAILVELGYITNPEEARLLASDSYLSALAQGLTQGVVAYVKQLDRFALGEGKGGS